jgi:hypothetical protein
MRWFSENGVAVNMRKAQLVPLAWSGAEKKQLATVATH